MKHLLKTSVIICAALAIAAGCKKNKDIENPENPSEGNAAVESVSVETAITLDEGATKQLTATVLPENAADKSVKWKSDNEEVASVDEDGLVTAVKWGEADITVTTVDGGKRAKCTVTVKKVKKEATDDTDISSRFDKNFALHLKARGIVKDENSIKYSEVKDVKKLEDGPIASIYDTGVKSLDGIEYFTALETIDWRNFTELSSIDLSWNVNLKKLLLGAGKFTSLDLSKNVNLEELELRAGEFTSLDLSKNVNLKILRFYNSAGAVNSLDLTSCTKLTTVAIERNVLEDFRIGECPALEHLALTGNSLASLDLSGCPALQRVSLDDNKLTSLTFAGNCDNLYWLHCDSNKLTTLDVSGCKNLQQLSCRNNLMTGISVYDITTIDTTDAPFGGNPGKDGRFTVYNPIYTYPDFQSWLYDETDANSKVVCDLYCEAAPQLKTHPSDAKLVKGQTCVFSIGLKGPASGLKFGWRFVTPKGILYEVDDYEPESENEFKISGAETTKLSVTIYDDYYITEMKDYKFLCVVADTKGHATYSKAAGFITE